jgi:putative tryptophan/tyrosine transport system substrate-binding protein
MRRRAFIGLLICGGAGASLPAAAQPLKKPFVALVFTGVSDAEIAGPDPTFAPAQAFVHELRELGWVDGETVLIERRTLAGDPKRASSLFSDLVGRGVDVIALGGARWLHDAALNATRTTPLVTLFQDDPVASGLIASLARPGGNLTGVAQTTGPELFRKRLQLLKEIAPHISRVALLGPRGVLEQESNLPVAAGVTVIPVLVDLAEQLDAAFETIRRERADGLMVAGSAITYGYSPRIVAFSAENTLPTIHAFREAVEAGGLASYGTSIPGIFRQMARLTDRILKGSHPQDLPTERATSFELVVNARTAKTLGLVVPPTMLALADEVIE